LCHCSRLMLSAHLTMTLGNAAAAHVRLVVWCRDCQHRVEPDPAEQAARYGADLPVIDWVKRHKCSRRKRLMKRRSQCGSHSVDFVLTGARDNHDQLNGSTVFRLGL
jgi:hypothetical protein